MTSMVTYTHRKARVGAGLVIVALGLVGFVGARASAESTQIADTTLREAAVGVATDSLSEPVTAGIPDEPAAVIGDAINAAEFEDLTFIAEQSGEDLGTTIARVGWQADFSRLVHDLASTFPDDFAGAAVDDAGDPWIAFRAEVPGEAARIIASFESAEFHQSSYSKPDGSRYAVDVRTDRGFSERQLEEQMIAAHFKAMGAKGLVETAFSSYNTETGTIEVRVRPVETYAKAGASELAQMLGIAQDNVLLVVDGTLAVKEAALYGGSAQTSCTSAFTVQNSSGTRGMLTAGHCPDSGEYQLGSALTLQSQYYGYWGDYQWATTSAAEYDDFYGGYLSNWQAGLRDVSGLGYPSAGIDVCRNGKTTGKSCTTVLSTNNCFGSLCHQTMAANHVALPGDSGGPWYYGNLAYGVHYGWVTYGSNSYDFWSPSDYVSSALNVTISTT